MSDPSIHQALAPVARAHAENLARRSGVSLEEFLERLVLGQSEPVPVRRYSFYRGGVLTMPASVVGGAGPLTYAGEAPYPGTGQDQDGFLSAARYAGYALPDVAATGAMSTGRSGSLDYPGAAFIFGPPHGAGRSAIATVAVFPSRIDQAAMLLSAAFAEADVRDFALAHPHRRTRSGAPASWYAILVENCVRTSKEVMGALVHRWTPVGRARSLWDDAFDGLTELTPAPLELMALRERDRDLAGAELAKHLDLATRQFELSANLLAEPEDRRFVEARSALLERAGGGVSLSQGAKLFGISRQALHKRIRSGATLGMKAGKKIVLPAVQWVDPEARPPVTVPGLVSVTGLFGPAGGWAALQFLVDPDPNLGGRPPLEALRSGEVDGAVAAARAYLGLDEG